MSEQNKAPAPAKATTEALKKTEGKLSFGKRVTKWFRDMKSELKKVIWPTSKQILNNTMVALVMMASSSVVIWGFDQLATMGVKALINLVG
ncbi:MAG: preprotein translocase subunit SecE [Oscillospiraceae bacterium]